MFKNNNFAAEKDRYVKINKEPVLSYGIIAFSDRDFDYNSKTKGIIDSIEEKINNPYGNLKVLMIERRNTMGYNDFIRGRYFNNNEENILKVYLNEMTLFERNKIKNLSFDELWDDLWCNHNCIQFKQDKNKSKKKYSKINVQKLLEETCSNFSFTEFGFPKGRKNNKENILDCAKREFTEETCYFPNDYTILDIPPLYEIFTGTNNIVYKHIYYLAVFDPSVAKKNVNILNHKQYEEVSNLDFFYFNDAFKVFRDYDVEKKEVLKKAFDIVYDVIYPEP